MNDSIRKQASELFNSLPDVDRKKAGLGYSLAQLTTISQIREKNKSTWKLSDMKLAEWQLNVQRHIQKEFLAPKG
jgi:hypothetical protein